MIIATIKSEEIRKKEIIAQVKKKRIILKRNKRINEKHDKYLKQQNQEQNNSKNSKKTKELTKTKNVKRMSKLNQSQKFHDFENESNNEEMMKYSKNESMKMSKKQTFKNEEQNNTKIKIIKKQVKELITLKKLKISDSIRVMKKQKTIRCSKNVEFNDEFIHKAVTQRKSTIAKEICLKFAVINFKISN
jgi:hypothetical protein